MTIPYTFAGATTAIPLAQLDSNFASPITLGNVAMTLSNTYTSIGNLTLTNVTISSASGIAANTVAYANSSGVLSGSTNLSYNGTGLGLGVSAATQLLQLHNGNLYFDTANYVMWDAGASWSITSDASTKLAFSAGGSERMRIDSSGNLCVATTTAYQKANVNGSIATKGIYGSFNTVLSVVTGGAAVSFGNTGLILVQGGIGGNNFWDLVICQAYGNATVMGSATYGSPSTRTYTSASGVLTIALTGGTSGTYNVNYLTMSGS